VVVSQDNATLVIPRKSYKVAKQSTIQPTIENCTKKSLNTTDYTVQDYSFEVDRCSASQEISCFYGTRNFITTLMKFRHWNLP
jgi:hypothetical protein